MDQEGGSEQEKKIKGLNRNIIGSTESNKSK